MGDVAGACDGSRRTTGMPTATLPRAIRKWLKRAVLGAFALALLSVLMAHRTAWAMVRYVGDPGPLQIPVRGVKAEALRSSWGEPRSGRRTHKGIDIFAKRGTAVVAAAEGEVVRIGTTDPLGGNTVWIAGKPS